jgi:hypothetical protein
MVIFHGYVSLPEGNHQTFRGFKGFFTFGFDFHRTDAT